MLSLDRRARAHDVAPLPNAPRRRKERRAPEQVTGVSGNQALADEILSSRITRPLESSYLNWTKSHGQITYNLAMSGVSPCDVRLLSPSVDDFTMAAENEYGWPPLVE